MLNQRVGPLLLVLALAVVAGGWSGFAASRLFESNANAKGNSAPQGTREIVVPPEGLTFKTTDGKTIATLGFVKGDLGNRNTLVIFNEAGKRAVELLGSSWGGEVSIHDERDRAAAVSMFATPRGGQISIMGDLKAAVYLSAGKDGGHITLNESHQGFPALTLGVTSQRGSIEVLDGSEGKVVWSAPR